MSGFKKQNPRHVAAFDLLDWMGSYQIRYRRRDYFNNPADYTLYRHLVSTVIRHKIKYGFIIEQLTGRSLQKLDKEVIICLMIGLSQLEQKSRIDDFAAVFESVNLAPVLKKTFLKGFINANLRSYLRERKELDTSISKQSIDIITSHDKKMVDRWRKYLGNQKTESICRANNRTPIVQLVVNPSFDMDEMCHDLIGLGYEISNRHNDGITILNPMGLFDTKWANQGAFLVQDRSSQNINKLIKDLPKKRVLDACASPGGKLFHLEWGFGENIEMLVGMDITSGRINRLINNWKLFNSRSSILRADAQEVAFKSLFDLILIDVPCSGTGTIRKNPEVKWNRKPTDFIQNQKKQLAILENLCRNVVPTGHLLYVTCSLEREENQLVIENFLSRYHREFRLIPFDQGIFEKEHITLEGYYQCLPTANEMGSFAALLQKN